MRKIAILGYGKEGQAVHAYFRGQDAEVAVFDRFNLEDLPSFGLESYDLVFRSPSVPLPAIPGVEKLPSGEYKLPANLTSSTKYFFAHCPCPIIGVTGTKGKGTTCSMTAAILREAGQRVHLVGNIGIPAIAELDSIMPSDVVVYEMSSFQLWDLTQSPQVAVVLRIEPDHLDVHSDFADYLAAKSHIAAYQTPADTCIYFAENPNSTKIAEQSPAQHKIPYPEPENPELKAILDHLTILGAHNRENAQAAILAAAATPFREHSELTSENEARDPRNGGRARRRFPEGVAAAAKRALSAFKPLPHHLELVRTLNGVNYYDDSFSASYPSMDVAISSLENTPTILIAGGKNRHLDLQNAQKRIFSAPSVKKLLLMGETAPLLAEGQNPAKYELVGSLKEAVEKARRYAEALATPSTPAAVLLSPGAASFDMFQNFADRGDQFQKLVRGLKND